MPRVSVIVPAYNAERHIAETLRSVERQRYGDWEVVVADDGSSDRTAAIVESFAPRVRLVRGAGNAGPAPARNLAIEHSSGELLAFLDADDLWLPEYLEHQVRLYDEHRARGERVGVVACDAHLLGPGGLMPETHADRAGFIAQPTVTDLLEANPIFISALSPRVVVDEVGRFSPETFGSEDHDLWLRIVERGYRVVTTRRPLAIYRLGAESVSANLIGMARTNQATLRRALERGQLDARQRRLARRNLRFQRAVEDFEALAAGRGADRGLARLASGALAFLDYAVHHPRRWPRWARAVLGGRLALWRPPDLDPEPSSAGRGIPIPRD